AQGEQLSARAGVPDLDLPGAFTQSSGAGEAAAVGAVADAAHPTGVSAQGQDRGASTRVPDLNYPWFASWVGVPGGAGQVAAVGAVTEAAHAAGVPARGGALDAAAGVPELVPLP